MRLSFKRVIVLLIALPMLILPVSTPGASASGCPKDWPLQFAPRAGFINAFLSPLRLDTLEETSGLLERYRSELGNNIAIRFQLEFSSDGTRWVNYGWPMTYPDGEYFEFGSRALLHLYPGYQRGTISIEVKGCSEPGIFRTASSKFPEVLLKGGYTLPELIGSNGDFRNTEMFVAQVTKEIDAAIRDFGSTGRISQNFPTDDPRVILTPRVPGCMKFEGPFPGFWVSKGKSCEVFLYSESVVENGKRVAWATATDQIITNFNDPKDLQNAKKVYFVGKSFELKQNAKKVSLLCVRKKAKKIVMGLNPVCPKGFVEKSRTSANN